MTDPPVNVNVQLTCVAVSPLPIEHPDWEMYAIKVQWRGNDVWAVTRGRQCLNRDGEWEWEPLLSNGSEEFLARCRFDYDTALRLAVDAAPKVRINGRSAAEIAREDTR